MHHHPLRPLFVTCLALATCTALAEGVSEDVVSSQLSPAEWSAPPSPLRQSPPGPAWRHLPFSDPYAPLLADTPYAIRLETVPEDTPRPMRHLNQGVPKRLYFAPRLGKRSNSTAQDPEERDRRGEMTYPEEPQEAGQSYYRWWWPLVSVRRSSFSPRPGKRAEGQNDFDLPYDYLPDDLYDSSYQDDAGDEENEAEDERRYMATLQDKRGSGFSFSPRLGKRGGPGFSFGPRPGKKSTFAFGPRPGKKATFAFGPRPGKKSSFAFGPRPGKKSTFAFAPRPGKKTNFAFGPRPGKKANFAFAPRTGKRSGAAEGMRRQDGEA
ncbi:uncharacterized protein LOC127008641 isoform X2 [Eriocheir sinensis]|nr:uncharacterized protein LOC127008641 isoform X2 [Eriocheir sinensis]